MHARHRSSRNALVLLAALRVKGRAPNTGYARDRFGPARTHDNDDTLGYNGCDTRNDILRRDLKQVVIELDGCTVLTATLRDPYTAARISFIHGVATSADVQIDHVVALDDAWQTGAQQWMWQRRTDLANDPLNLPAVDGPTNESKGDGDAGTWCRATRPTAPGCRWVAEAGRERGACAEQHARRGGPRHAPGGRRFAARSVRFSSRLSSKINRWVDRRGSHKPLRQW